MKKLLSILTISTLTASTPAPLLANTTLTRVKSDVEITKKDITNGFNIKTSDLTNYWKIVLSENKPFSKVDNKWYFVIWKSQVEDKWTSTFFENNSDKARVIDRTLSLSKMDYLDLFAGGKGGGIERTWSKDNGTYFKNVYCWDNNNKPITTPIINNDTGQIINWNLPTPEIFNNGINFSIDNDKNGYWIKPYQLVTNGQVHLKIKNELINNVKLGTKNIDPTPNKIWEIDLPNSVTDISNKDYTITIDYNFNSINYTGTFTVTTLFQVPTINVMTKATSTVINSYVYQVPTNDKVGEVTLTSDLYYSDTEVKVSLNKPTGSTVQSGVVYGLNENWQKTGKQLTITKDVSLNATMLNAFQGRFLVETKDSANNSSVYYIVLNKDNLTPNFWNTDQGEQFYQWTNFNGYNENIKKLNATELNKIIKASENWQKIATDSQFVTAVAEWFKNNAKLSSKDPLTAEQVIEQLKKQIPSTIKIPAINTNNYDPTKVSFELDKSEFKPNDKVNITVKYNNEKSTQFTLQINDSKVPDNSGGDSKLWIIGVVVGVLAFAGIAYLLFKRFIFDKYIYPKIISRRHHKIVEQVRKEEAEKDKQNNGGQE